MTQARWRGRSLSVGMMVGLLAWGLAGCSSDDDKGAAGAAGMPGGSAGAAGSESAGSSGSAGTGGSASTGGSAGTNAGGTNAGCTSAGSVTVTPASPTVLTCTTTAFTAGSAAVTWSATAGTIDATGHYTSPKQVGPDVTITATSQANAKGSTTVKLATAVPGPQQVVAVPFDRYPVVYPHAAAARGDRVYAAYGANTDTTNEVRVVRSDDGGKTWGAPVLASPPIKPGANVSCVAVAVDVENPDVVYTVFNFDSHSGLVAAQMPTTDDDRGLGLLISTDGGKTWPTLRLLQTGNSEDEIPVAQGICPDVTSIAKDTVAVETPGGSNDVGMFLWVDTKQGAGLTIGDSDAYNSIAAEETGALHTVSAAIGQNGGQGEIEESPELFTDGKGKLCVTYLAYTPPGSGSPSSAAWLQCSTDLGKTFGAPVVVSPTYTYEQVHLGHPHGSIAPDGSIAITWHGYGVETAPGGTVPVVGVAVSTDQGKTFTNVSPVVPQEGDTGRTAAAGDVHYDASGVLWLTYHVYDGGQSDRVLVDKSCDNGATWSGPVIVNADSTNTISDATLPGLVETANGSMSVVARAGAGDGSNDYQMRRYSLVP